MSMSRRPLLTTHSWLWGSYRHLGTSLPGHLPALIFFTSSPILGAVNLSLYLQPQQGAHFHRREDSFNKSSSFVQEQCSHWLEGWLELWLPLGRKLRKQIKGKWWAALSSWEAWGGGGGGGGDSPHILSHPCWLRVQIFWDELTPSG